MVNRQVNTTQIIKKNGLELDGKRGLPRFTNDVKKKIRKKKFSFVVDNDNVLTILFTTLI